MKPISDGLKLKLPSFVASMLVTFTLWFPLIVCADTQQLAKQRGEILIQPDTSLQDGRLIIRMAIQNRDKVNTAFALESVSLITASGKPVALLSAEQLSRRR